MALNISLDLGLNELQQFLKIKKEGQKRFLWDCIRSKWLVLLPEEMVRQLLIHHLINHLGINKNRIAIEKGLTVNGLQKRCDILVFDQSMQPFLLIECKAPSVKINQTVFRQIAQYNMALNVPYLLVCNGPDAYCCAIDFLEKNYNFLDHIPRG